MVSLISLSWEISFLFSMLVVPFHIASMNLLKKPFQQHLLFLILCLFFIFTILTGVRRYFLWFCLRCSDEQWSWSRNALCLFSIYISSIGNHLFISFVHFLNGLFSLLLILLSLLPILDINILSVAQPENIFSHSICLFTLLSFLSCIEASWLDVIP